MARTIEIEETITVGNLAEKLSLPATRLIGELMKNSILATINERIDFDTAQIIVGDLGLDVELAKIDVVANAPAAHVRRNTSGEGTTSRPPVVAVMGHVDHGKTSLLDAIRVANVAKGEAGGITQHISAYQIVHDGRPITFLDTPGHEAFAAIREHGALLTDIVVVVVAADDGIKPQTLEAIRFARKANVKILIAANKIDKEGANVDRLKQQLAEQDLVVEEWGGDTILQEVSAKTGKGIKELLDMILLVTDVEDLRADADGPARGLIIESHMETGRGPIANALVEEGTLKPGQFVVAGSTYARVRNLEDSNGRAIKDAGPSSPVVITGFKHLPEFGDEFETVDNEKLARQMVQQSVDNRKAAAGHLDMNSSELIRMINRNNEVSELNVILKADVQGSLASVVDSLKSLDTEEVSVRVVGSGVGALTENDVRMAKTSNAIIYGFNVDLPTNIKRLAMRDKVIVRQYRVIYELIDDTREELSKLLAPEIVEKETGRLVVKGVFKTTRTDIICGGEVTKGKLVSPSLARIFRGKEILGEVNVVNLKRGPQDAKEVFEGDMCGLELTTTSKIELIEGDKIEFFSRETIERHL